MGNKVKLVYDPGTGYSDAMAVLTAENHIDYFLSVNQDVVCRFGNVAYLDRWRYAIVSGEIGDAELVAVYGDITQVFNEYGMCADTPEIVVSLTSLPEKILVASVKRRKEVGRVSVGE